MSTQINICQCYEVISGTAGTVSPQWFVYDRIGNLTAIHDQNGQGTVQRAYHNGAQRGSADCSVGGLNFAHAAVGRTEQPTNVTTHYCYDKVGNMVERQTGSVVETLLYDPENHLTHHWNNTGTINATFAYNGDGQRTRATINGVTTLYAGLVEYEVNSGTLTKHYSAGGQNVAVRNGNSLNYLLNDHLGSTSVILKTNGTLWGELRYTAWGETRYSLGNIATDRQFTGQINDGATGLYYYNARYYDPALRKFIGSSAGLQASAAWEKARDGMGNFGFGHVMSGAGDVKDDGMEDVLVGAPLEDTFLSVPGYAYLYHG